MADPLKPFDLIVPAAGTGVRSGAAVPKQYVEIHGEAMLRHTLVRFHELDACRTIVVAIDPRWHELAERSARELPKVVLVSGGAERQHSIAAAIESLRDVGELLLVHDAARPCVSHALIARVVAAADRYGAAIPVMSVTETIKRVDGEGRVVETIPRDELVTVQTPQGFRAALLQKAYAHASEHGIAATDDAMLVEALGHVVHTVPGEATNIKVTHADDFSLASETILIRQGRQG